MKSFLFLFVLIFSYYLVRGRGRGAGRGIRGSPRGGKRGVPDPRGVTAPGRHSSYTPSPGNRGGLPNTRSEDFRVAGDIITPDGSSAKPMPAVKRVSGRPLANSLPTNGRPLPKFGDVTTNYEDEPTPPPRSPHVSPRLSNLPKLPPRPESSQAPLSSSNNGNSNSNGDDAEKEKRRGELRHRCLEEIHQTEKDYIDDLETLISVFFHFLFFFFYSNHFNCFFYGFRFSFSLFVRWLFWMTKVFIMYFLMLKC